VIELRNFGEKQTVYSVVGCWGPEANTTTAMMQTFKFNYHSFLAFHFQKQPTKWNTTF
jgi:uncharacterized protein (DUF2461 family)